LRRVVERKRDEIEVFLAEFFLHGLQALIKAVFAGHFVGAGEVVDLLEAA